jgi:hypothetical protein
MATIDEYQAVHGGKTRPNGKGTDTELGGGGCNVIFEGKGKVIGRWNSWDTASLALNQLQKLGGGAYGYRLMQFHHWMKEPGQAATCSLCSITREMSPSLLA